MASIAARTGSVIACGASAARAADADKRTMANSGSTERGRIRMRQLTTTGLILISRSYPARLIAPAISCGYRDCDPARPPALSRMGVAGTRSPHTAAGHGIAVG